MAGSFDFLHLKKHTAGSSNELSFDVLDAASRELDDKRMRGSRSSQLPKASQGSYHGVKGTSTLSAQAEVERRKRQRRAQLWRRRAVAVLVVGAVVAAGVIFGYRFYQDRIDFTGRYEMLVARFAGIDEVLARADAIENDPLDLASDDGRAAVLEQLPQVERDLGDIRTSIAELADETSGSQDIVALAELDESAQGRLDMTDAARGLFELADEASRQLVVAMGAWNSVMDADQLVREASAESNRATTEDALESSKQKTQQAIGQLAGALSDLEGIDAAYPDADFGEQERYLRKRIEALEYAVAAAEALEAGDREAATEANDAYNEADQEAARLASDLPLSVEGQIRAAFAPSIGKAQAAYGDARQQVIAADARVREHLSS